MTDASDIPLRQIRYQLTREDIAAFEFLPHELRGLEKLWLFGPVLTCGAAAGFFQDRLKSVLPWNPESQWGQALTVLIAIAIGYGLGMILLTARTRRRIARAVVPKTPTALDVYPQLFVVGEGGDDRNYVWSKISVAETATHIFLTESGRRPVIVPLRAFRDAGDMANFAAMARVLGRDDENESQDIEPDPASASKESRV